MKNEKDNINNFIIESKYFYYIMKFKIQFKKKLKQNLNQSYK